MKKTNYIKKKPLALTMLGLLFVLTFLGVSSVNAESKAGTAVDASVTATGFWEHYFIYDWAIQKSMDPASLEIDRGQTGRIDVSIIATRTVTESDVYGVRGMITITDGGSQTTENLKIVMQVQYKTGSGPYQDLAGASQTITPTEQLAPEQTESYMYEVQFTPIQGALYRNTAKVTITNHSGHLGQEFGPEPKLVFSLPNSPTNIFIDESAEVTDVESCPEVFTYVPSEQGSWYFTDSTTKQYTIDISNIAAPYAKYYEFTNTVYLKEIDSEQQHSASATVNMYSGNAPSIKPQGIGYWKNHAGFSGNNPDEVTQYLAIWLGASAGAKSIQVTSAAQAVEILGMEEGYGTPSNGITKLYAQLLAEKLNEANGADTSSVAGIVSQADAFLANNDWTSWNSLSSGNKNMVLGWMSILDGYNSGNAT